MRAALLATALAGSFLAADVAWAQSTFSPPRQSADSPTGVNYRSGSLSLSEQDLSIGGEGVAGLSLSRIYSSSVDRAGPAANWGYSTDGYVSAEQLSAHPDFEQPQKGNEPYVFNVVFGGKSVGFTGGSTYNGSTTTGGPVGPYQPALPSGAQLVFVGTALSGHYVFTDSDGSVVTFGTGASGRISSWVMPDGTRLDYTYNANLTPRSVISNRGWALIFESATKVCAVNMATSYVTATSSCPTDAQTVTYGTTASSYSGTLLTSATKSGRTTSYFYNSKDHLNCIKEPGQSVCKLQTTYAECANDPFVSGTQRDLHLRDYVTSQVDASGKTYSFSYSATGIYPVGCPKWHNDTDPDYRPFLSTTTTLTENGSATSSFELDISGLPVSIIDPLGRTSSITLRANGGDWGPSLPDATVIGVANPEGNGESYEYDGRGNLTSKTIRSKPGSGLSNLVTTASYPTTCSNIVTCNKPTSVIDPRLNVTSFTYDPVHGGVLTETAPADANGIQAVKRYAYAQRYAWIKNASGGFVQAASPVWVMTEERSCRSTATVGNSCAGGAGDEVIVSYDYGPNTGSEGNNLLLRGKTVTAQGSDGVIRSLRACYGYDRDGNKIWETSPRAGLTACY